MSDNQTQSQECESVYTANLPELLQQLDVSLLISTYQAGKLVMVRSDGQSINTHFRNFNRPMGIACQGGRLAIGTGLEVWEYHDSPGLAPDAAEGERRPDAYFLPRGSHTTGNVQIHELAWGWPRAESLGPRADGEAFTELSALGSRLSATLWFVNTRFSCLCTRDVKYSFVPQWQPPFVSQLAPEDRCHLNGLAMWEGRPALVSALGASDTPAGWRDNKASGGVLIDVSSGEIVTRGLSMPHSPRVTQVTNHSGLTNAQESAHWYVLNSGNGEIGHIDQRNGQYQPIERMPGFTRGLSFHGRYAFVGLSQVRESAVFSGIEIAQREDRWSGVAVVDLVAGRCVAWLRFEAGVQEVFAVEVLPGRTWPEIVNHDNGLISDAFVLPDAALGLVPEKMKYPSRQAG